MQSKNQSIQKFLAQGAQGTFLTIANRNGRNLEGTFDFTCPEQVAKLRKSTYKSARTNEERESFDAIIKITLKDKQGLYLIGARTLGIEPLDLLNEDQENEEEPLLKWPACSGKISMRLVTTNRDGEELPEDKQYYSIAVNLK